MTTICKYKFLKIYLGRMGLLLYIYYDTILSTFTDVTDRTTKVVLETQGSLLRTICVICVYI